jgi:hypothetical protein
MDNLIITETQYTPSVKMLTEGSINFVGKSYPENTFEFYKPVMEWLKTYCSELSHQPLNVSLEIIYFNSSSSKWFFDFFDVLNEHKDECKIHIEWIYDEENESAQEAGEDFIDDFPDLSIVLKSK